MSDRLEETEAPSLGIQHRQSNNIYDGQGKIIAESAVDMVIYWHIFMRSLRDSLTSTLVTKMVVAVIKVWKWGP